MNQDKKNMDVLKHFRKLKEGGITEEVEQTCGAWPKKKGCHGGKKQKRRNKRRIRRSRGWH